MKHALPQIRACLSFAPENRLAGLPGARVKLYVIDHPDTLWNKERPGATYVDLTTLQHSRHAVPRPVLVPVSPAVRHAKLDARTRREEKQISLKVCTASTNHEMISHESSTESARTNLQFISVLFRVTRGGCVTKLLTRSIIYRDCSRIYCPAFLLTSKGVDAVRK